MSKVLYLGTNPSRFANRARLIHLPLIQTKPLPLPLEIQEEFEHFTHVILTSPNAVQILLHQWAPHQKQILAIGKATATSIESKGYPVQAIATPETQEGMITLLEENTLKNAYVFYPRSRQARPLLANYLQEQGVKHRICDLYETVFLKPAHAPCLDEIEEIIFTSPSTVHAFISLYGTLPKDKKLTCIGPITQAALVLCQQSFNDFG